MARVASGQLQREFGRYRAIAQREAVIITNHGRDDLVLLRAADYARLLRGERRYRALSSSETSEPQS